jgi:hypothetical protein
MAMWNSWQSLTVVVTAGHWNAAPGVDVAKEDPAFIAPNNPLTITPLHIAALRVTVIVAGSDPVDVFS